MNLCAINRRLTNKKIFEKYRYWLGCYFLQKLQNDLPGGMNFHQRELFKQKTNRIKRQPNILT